MKILYVELESTTREFILEVINSDDHEIEVATSAAEALQFIDFENYDLIIADFRLPQNGGVNILRKLIKSKRFPKLIYFSSVRPRKSKNLRKLLKRQNIFYVPRGMTSLSIDGLLKEINTFEVGIYQRLYEEYLKNRGNKKPKNKNSDDQKINSNEAQKIKSLLDVEVEEDGHSPISADDFGMLGDISSPEEFENTFNFNEKEYVEESESDWGDLSENKVDESTELDPDELEWKVAPKEAVDADWSIDKKNAGEEEADWSLDKNKLEDEEADWSLKKQREAEGELDPENFIDVNVNRLRILQDVPCDVYFFLGSRKMIKIANQGDQISDEFFEKLAEKSIESLYILKLDFHLFDEMFGKKLNAQLKQSADSKVDKIQMLGAQLGFDYVRKQMQTIGVSERTLHIAEKTIQNTLGFVLKERKLLSSLKTLLMGKSYIPEHSLMISTVAIEMLKQLEWSGVDNNDKIAIAALYHDCFLKDDRLARINRADQLNALSSEERKIVENHPILAAQTLEKSKAIGPDVLEIVVKHHERPNDCGFPNRIQPQAIGNLASTFILAEEVVEFLYQNKFDVSEIGNQWEEHFMMFDVGNFKKPLEIIKKIFLSNN